MGVPLYTPDDWYWRVGDDSARWWSSAAAEYVTELPPDAGVTAIGTEEELWEVLRQQAANGLPREQRRVLKSIVQQRLIDAGLIGAAYEMLVANPAKFARWFAPGHSEINVTDQDALLLLEAIGADPNKFLDPSARL